MAYGVKQSKSVANARAVEGPARSTDEPRENILLVVCVGASVFFVFACFRFAADKAGSPVAYGVKQSKSVANARAVEGPACSVDEPSAPAAVVWESWTPVEQLWVKTWT